MSSVRQESISDLGLRSGKIRRTDPLITLPSDPTSRPRLGTATTRGGTPGGDIRVVRGVIARCLVRAVVTAGFLVRVIRPGVLTMMEVRMVR